MAVDIDKAGEQVEKASSFFDKVNAFIRKHPIWFIVLLFAGFVYWGSTLETEEEEVPADPYYNDEYYEDYGADAQYIYEEEEYYTDSAEWEEQVIE